MSTEVAQNVEEIILSLIDRFPVKVWSYLATIFGDLSDGTHVKIPGPLLSKLTERIGIKPEAMRVALHRLRKDEWLSSEKVGRVSLYKLNAMRDQETRWASRRIFSAHLHEEQTLYLVFNDPSEESHAAIQEPVLEIGKDIYLTPCKIQSKSAHALVLKTRSNELPDWMKKKFIQDGWERDCEDFLQAVKALQSHTGSFAELSFLDRATVRLMLVHNWRRLVLRLPEVVELIQSPDWVGQTCRAETLWLLERLPRSDLDGLVQDTYEPITETVGDCF